MSNLTWNRVCVRREVSRLEEWINQGEPPEDEYTP